jgi:hypothetical protein
LTPNPSKEQSITSRKEGANVAVLEPDVAEAFRDSASVNAALRSLLDVSEATQRLITRPKRQARKNTSV